MFIKLVHLLQFQSGKLEKEWKSVFISLAFDTVTVGKIDMLWAGNKICLMCCCFAVHFVNIIKHSNSHYIVISFNVTHNWGWVMEVCFFPHLIYLLLTPSMCGGNREPSTHGVGWYALLYVNAPALIWILPPQKLKTQVYSWRKVSQSAQRGNPTVPHQKVKETLVEVQPIRLSLVPCVWLFSSFFIISDEEQEFGIIFI